MGSCMSGTRTESATNRVTPTGEANGPASTNSSGAPKKMSNHLIQNQIQMFYD